MNMRKIFSLAGPSIAFVLAVTPANAQTDEFWRIIKEHEHVKEYLSEFRTKVMSACIDFDASTENQPVIPWLGYNYNIGDIDLFTSKLRASSMEILPKDKTRADT